MIIIHSEEDKETSIILEFRTKNSSGKDDNNKRGGGGSGGKEKYEPPPLPNKGPQVVLIHIDSIPTSVH